MQTSELENSLALGGLPMPSIATIKAKNGHSEYGDVRLVFDKDTIDPQLSKDNKVYGGDAWTPTYPTIEYKANEKIEDVGYSVRDGLTLVYVKTSSVSKIESHTNQTKYIEKMDW